MDLKFLPVEIRSKYLEWYWCYFLFFSSIFLPRILRMCGIHGCGEPLWALKPVCTPTPVIKIPVTTRVKMALRIAANICLAMQAKIYKWMFHCFFRYLKWTAPTLLSSAHFLVKILASWHKSEHGPINVFCALTKALRF